MTKKKMKRHLKVKKIAVRTVKKIAPDTHAVDVQLIVKDAPEIPAGPLPAILDFDGEALPKNGGSWYSWLKHLLW